VVLGAVRVVVLGVACTVCGAATVVVVLVVVAIAAALGLTGVVVVARLAPVLDGTGTAVAWCAVGGVANDWPAPSSTNDPTRTPVAALRLEIRSQLTWPRTNATSAAVNATTPTKIKKPDTRTTFPRISTETDAARSGASTARCVTSQSVSPRCR
jgi:hypothetical protein